MRLILGDCLEKLKELPDNSVDSIVTDPPYGLGFMNKEWDSPEKLKKNLEHHKQKTEDRGKASFSPLPFERYGGKKEGQWFQEWCEEWGRECLRVLKPGGHMLSFSAPRMYHRMTTGLEDAGFQIRDQIMWVFGSGFPKSHNIGKAVDKLLGNEREYLGETNQVARRSETSVGDRTDSGAGMYSGTKTSLPITKGQSEWEGWGTALKPAHEPIVVARKPLSEKSVAENVLKWGTGGLNIDVSRIGLTSQKDLDDYRFNMDGNLRTTKKDGEKLGMYDGGWKVEKEQKELPEGRWPANIMFDEDTDEPWKRFFYCPKTSKKDRNEGMPEEVGIFHQRPRREDGTIIYKENNPEEWDEAMSKLPRKDKTSKAAAEEKLQDNTNGLKNNHPTVKPTSLMEYLIKLVTPVGGIVLDPFMGSGSTGKGAVRNGFDFIGIEKEEEYMKISEARIKNELDGDKN
jgi:site-specific DNA-methyltransferase (adenine-specific)